MATAKPDTSEQAPAEVTTPDVVSRPSFKTRFAEKTQKIRAFLGARHFTLLPTIIAAIACCILLGLGTWQVMRQSQKNDLIAHITTQLEQGEVDLRLKLPKDDAAWLDLDYRGVAVQGEWLDLHNLKLLPRTYEGQNGYHLITPLRLANGQTLLVNRGWVPDKTDIGLQSQNGTAMVAGIVRYLPDNKPFGMVENDPISIARGEWAWPDTLAIAKAIGVEYVVPVVLYAERAANDADADNFPIGGQAQLAIRNEHRQYALTWYSMALGLLVVWLGAAQRRTPKTVESTEKPDAERD
ncbi:MAG TPA: SURF1 family protein [Alphaproteobacteria bacterium]